MRSSTMRIPYDCIICIYTGKYAYRNVPMYSEIDVFDSFFGKIALRIKRASSSGDKKKQKKKKK